MGKSAQTHLQAQELNTAHWTAFCWPGRQQTCHAEYVTCAHSIKQDVCEATGMPHNTIMVLCLYIGRGPAVAAHTGLTKIQSQALQCIPHVFPGNNAFLVFSQVEQDCTCSVLHISSALSANICTPVCSWLLGSAGDGPWVSVGLLVTAPAPCSDCCHCSTQMSAS